MKKVVKILRGIGYLLAFSLILYPVVSNYINQMNSTTIATDYEQEVSHLSEEQENAMIEQGQSPYSATKIGADRLAESFYRSFNLPVAIVRPFNTFGPRQSARAVIPTIITQLLAGKEEIKLGSLTPTRDFNYVKDTAAGFIAIAESDKTIGQEINIATEREISIGDLAKEIIAQINPDAKIVCDEQRLRPEKSEVNRLLGANAKIKELTDWKQQYTFEQGIAETIAWIRQNMDAYKTDIYNV